MKRFCSSRIFREAHRFFLKIRGLSKVVLGLFFDEVDILLVRGPCRAGKIWIFDLEFGSGRH